MLNQWDPDYGRQLTFDPSQGAASGYGAPPGTTVVSGGASGGPSGGGGLPFVGSGGPNTLPAAVDHTASVFGSGVAGGGSAATGGNMATWLPWAIQGASTIIGSLLGKKGQDNASAAQERMSERAIAEQRRNQELERRRLATMWDAYNQRRAMLMARYGLDVPEVSNPFVANMPESYPDYRGGSLRDLTTRDEWRG